MALLSHVLSLFPACIFIGKKEKLKEQSKIVKIKVTQCERVTLSGRVFHAKGPTPD